MKTIDEAHSYSAATQQAYDTLLKVLRPLKGLLQHQNIPLRPTACQAFIVVTILVWKYPQLRQIAALCRSHCGVADFVLLVIAKLINYLPSCCATNALAPS